MQNISSPAIQNFIVAANKEIGSYWERMKLTYAPAPTIVARETERYIVLHKEGKNHEGQKTDESIFAFIVRGDFYTRTLGVLKEGDILRPATYKAPAKHARGNVFSEQGGTEAIAQGSASIRYL